MDSQVNVTAPLPPQVASVPVESMPNQVESGGLNSNVTKTGFNWLWLVGSLFVLLFIAVLVYFFFIKGRVGNSIVINPQELTQQIFVSELIMEKKGFFVLFIGDEFNVPKYAFYSSPLLPPGSYKDITIEIDKNNYDSLMSTYKPNTKFFGYIFEDTNNSGEFDNVDGAALGEGPDKPFKNLSGDTISVEVLRP